MEEQKKEPEGTPKSDEDFSQRPRRRVHWVWPLGLAVAGIGGAAAFMLRGCWHMRMGWPIRHDDEFSYQVCLGCGVKRLFDPKTFHAYGSYGYDLHELIAHERALRLRRARRHEENQKRNEELRTKSEG